ncbi:BsaWI family type II restriction enzyme [Thermodesulfovibrio hydrogeniphilus]
MKENRRLKFDDVVKLYNAFKERFGTKSYNHISKFLEELKVEHKKIWEQHPTTKKDHEQSWRAFKGKNFEKLIKLIIKDQVSNLGLKIIEGNKLERQRSEKLGQELNTIKRNLLIHYGEFGSHLPDVDLIIYNPKDLRVLSVISSKITLRERIAQTGYWKLKLASDCITKHIKVFFITPDEDKTLFKKFPTKKGRAIVEVDTDGCYVMTEEKIEESEKSKNLKDFLMTCES